MNKTYVIIFLWIITILMSSAGTGIFVYKYTYKDPPAPEPEPVVSKPVHREAEIPKEEARLHLWHYDNDPFKIKWKTLYQKDESLMVQINGSLYQREFEQKALLPIEVKSGNWKIGFGIVIGVAIVGGGAYAMHKAGWF